jgi:hypothetical protein
MKTLFILLFLLSHSVYAGCNGRVDIGPAYASIDMLESGKTTRTLNLRAVKGDATLIVWDGLCLKPSFLLADGKATLKSGSIGIGYVIPICDNFCITPSYGVTETRFQSHIDFANYGLFHLKEKFVSRGQYISLDASWTFADHWRLYGMAQFCWSHVRTKIGSFPTAKNKTEGPNYALAIERDINKQFSISLAAGYNLSLSKEKHGLRGKGIKLGLAYWY